MEQTQTVQQVEAQFEDSNEQFSEYQEDSYEYDYEEDQEYESEEDDFTGEAFDFSIKNQTMKTKKFKAQKVQETVEESVYEEDGVEKIQGTFKGADKIFSQIMWDEKLNKNDFIVGYEDRFMGIIEEPFSVFEILKEEIPFHRIRFYKRGEEVVWDRKKKLNKL